MLTVIVSRQDITVYRITHSNLPLKFNYAQWAHLRDFALLKAMAVCPFLP